jgi:hypothetical protein
MNETNQRLSSDDIEALLPWYAAGTLDAREAAQVEAALIADTALARRLDLVREEMTEAIILNEALGVPSARVMENLFRAIDLERHPAHSATLGSLSGRLRNMLTPRSFAFAAGAAMLVIALEAGVIAKLAMQDRIEHGPFTPQGTTTIRGFEVETFVLVRFTPQASMADVTRFLDSRDAAIVDGPRPDGPNGLYKVRIARSYVLQDELERLVKDFQSSNIVAMVMLTD